MKDINDFYLYYEETLKPIIEENLAKCNAFKRIDRIIVGFCVLYGIILAISSWTLAPVFISLATIPFFYFKKSNMFAYPEYKTRLMSGIVKFMDENLSYRRNDSIGNYGLGSSGISFDKVDKYEASDIIRGDLNGVNTSLAFVKGAKFALGNGLRAIVVLQIIAILFVFLSILYPRINEIHLTIGSSQLMAVSTLIQYIIFLCALMYKLIKSFISADNEFSVKGIFGSLPGSSNSTFMKEVFKGLLLSMDFNKDFRFRTLGVTRTFVGNFVTPMIPDGLKTVELENQNFMENFLVYSDNQQEARYLLTPAMMESLLGLKLRLNKPVNFSFYNSRIYISIEQDAFFESGDFQGDSFEVVAEFYVSLSELIDMAKSLDLDRRIWMKI